MIRPVIAALLLSATLGIQSAPAQENVTFKRFAPFRQIVPGIDFYASNRKLVAPYEKPVAETVARLKSLFGMELPKGAIFICSNLEQKDSIYEPMILKKGYSWTLSAITPEVRQQEIMARIKSQMGGNIPAEIQDRIKNRPPEMAGDMEKQMVATVTQQIAYAVTQTMLDKGLKFRSNRLDDMGKSPLPDWLDIGIAAYASGVSPNLSYLQQHLDQTFPIEDVIAMSRPFVASSSNQNGSGGGGRGGGQGGGQGGGFPQGMGQGMGQGMPQGMPQGMGQGMPQGMPGGGFGGPMGGGNFGGFGGGNGNGGRGGGQQRAIPKDEQDRMLFDGQASTLFSYLIEKVGIDKVKELVKLAVEGKESREFVTRNNVLGSDFSKIEENWGAWVKTLSAPQSQFPR